nr:LCP family protein [Candidatus Gracilibacteria bacterium]
MGFKTKKIKVVKVNKISKIKKSIPYIIGILSITVISILGFFTIESIGNFNFNFNFKLPNIISNLNFDSQTENKDNQIKILLVGRGGGNHDAPDLTDSMILADINLDKNIVSMLSIPRDLYVSYDDGKRKGKINEIYMHYKNLENDENKAMDYLKNKVSEITGEKIDYYVNIDFSGFKQIVDMLGGITITVPETLVDYTYPDGKGGYTTFVLKAGTWDIDGETALKYARSRHSTSDFDRSLRQQKILTAIKEKMISDGYFSNPFKIKKMYSTMSPYFTTDIGLNGILKIASDFKNLGGGNNIISLNLNNSCVYGFAVCEVGGILYTPPMEDFGGASILLPRDADYYNLEKYGEIQRFSKIVFEYPEVFIDKQEINIFNSSGIPNKAMYLANDLQQFGFNIPEKNSIGNIGSGTYEQTTILYNNLGKNTKTLDALKLFIKGKYVETDKPQHSKNPDTKIEIIIGKDFTDISDFNGTN